MRNTKKRAPGRLSRTSAGPGRHAGVTLRPDRNVDKTAGPSGVRTADTGDNPIPRRLRDAPSTYIFSLAAIRTKLGDRWEQFGPSVHRIAKRLLFGSLDGKGSFEKFGDAYVIQFDRLRGAPAHDAGQRLYDNFLDLLSKGKGADAVAERRERNSAAATDGHGGFLRRLYRRVKGLFRRRGDRGSPGEPEDEATGQPDSSEENADAGDSNGGLADRTGVGAAPRNDAPPPSRRLSARRFKPRLDDADDSERTRHSPRQSNELPDNLKLLREARAMEDAIALAVLRRHSAWSRETASTEFPPPNLDFIYRSMWNLRSRHLTTYTSVPICWKNSMEIQHGEDVVPAPRFPENLFKLDMLCLENTIRILGRLLKQKRQVLFMNAVHASTLAHRDTLAEFLALAESIPQAACRQLLFEIVDIHDHAHRPEAVRMVRALSSCSRAVTASVTLQDRNFAFWKQCGFMAVGADISRDQRTEEQIIGNLGHFAAAAKQHKLVSYLRELDKHSVTICAFGAGFDFLEGASVGSSDDPDNLALSEFDVANLYKEPEVVWLR